MNMLRNIKFYLSALAILVGATSCLDKYPGSSIPEKEAMRTFADAEQTLTGIYASLKSNALYSGYLTLLPDIPADPGYAVEGNTNTYGSFWRWDIRPTDLQLEAVYAALYKVIGNCNFYLDRIDEVVANEISDTNIEKLEQYTGEVYAVRALCYTELLKTFCKAYEPDTAQSELGVVLRTKYFTPEAARRASLYDSYQFVLDDLAEAEKRLDKENDAYGNVYMTSASAEALHARVALYMQDWDTAIEYSSTLIDEKKATFQLSDAKTNYTSDYTYFDYMWAYDLGYEVIWRIGFTDTSYGGALGTVFLNFNKDYTYFYPDYVPGQAALDLYDDADLRYSGYFYQTETGYAHGLSWPLLVKYYGNRNLIANQIYHVSMPKPFRLAEQYLIRAEANIEWAGGDLGVAKADIETIRGRAHMPVLTVSDRNGLRSALRYERMVELCNEGFRWFDIRRWGIAEEVISGTLYAPASDGSMSNAIPTIDENWHVTYKGDTFDGKKINLRKFIDMAFDPMKDYLWPIPESERIALPQITQNPGYAGFAAE